MSKRDKRGPYAKSMRSGVVITQSAYERSHLSDDKLFARAENEARRKFKIRFQRRANSVRCQKQEFDYGCMLGFAASASFLKPSRNSIT